MADIDWQRVRDVAGQALELPGGERADFLARECAGDARLREQVERLLAQELASGGDFLEPPSELPPSPSAQAPSQRLHLGEFEILRELGPGGMGVVYLARQ